MPIQEYTYNRTIYYVDYHWEQFRTKLTEKQNIKFISFDDPLGDRILAKMIREGVADLSKLNL